MEKWIARLLIGSCPTAPAEEAFEQVCVEGLRLPLTQGEDVEGRYYERQRGDSHADSRGMLVREHQRQPEAFALF